MFWTILFLLLSAIAPTQPVATRPVPISDINQTGRQFNPYGPGTKPNCRPQVPGAKCVVE